MQQNCLPSEAESTCHLAPYQNSLPTAGLDKSPGFGVFRHLFLLPFTKPPPIFFNFTSQLLALRRDLGDRTTCSVLTWLLNTPILCASTLQTFGTQGIPSRSMARLACPVFYSFFCKMKCSVFHFFHSFSLKSKLSTVPQLNPCQGMDYRITEVFNLPPALPLFSLPLPPGAH